jgi:hypothetical protein
MGNRESESGVGSGLPPFLARLVEQWAEEGIRPAGGAGEEAVRVFEARRGVRLPAGLRTYFRDLGGSAGADGGIAMDADLIRFWSMHEVETLASSWVPAPDAERWFVLADYSIWAWGYAVRLSPDPDEPAPVAVSFGGAELLPLADSFEQFVGMYLERDPRVVSPDLENQRE